MIAALLETYARMEVDEPIFSPSVPDADQADLLADLVFG
jgi:hypothetical protein